MLVKLFIGNLAWTVDDEQLEMIFQDFGTVQSARVINDRETGRSRGFGFVEIEVDDVSAVIRATDGMEVSGREIRVNEADDKGPSRGGGGGPRGGGGGGGGRRGDGDRRGGRR